MIPIWRLFNLRYSRNCSLHTIFLLIYPQDVNVWLEDSDNAQSLSEINGILELMYDVQSDTDAKEQEATIALDNYKEGIKLSFFIHSGDAYFTHFQPH